MKAVTHTTNPKSRIAPLAQHILSSTYDAEVQTIKNITFYRSVATQTDITSRPEVNQEVEQSPDSDSDLDSIHAEDKLYYAPTSPLSSADSMDTSIDDEVDVSLNKEKIYSF